MGFTSEYNQFCENVEKHENHSNIIILANHNFQRVIFADESLTQRFRTIRDSEKGFVNFIYDHHIVFTPLVESYEFINMGYENNYEEALKPYLDKEKKSIQKSVIEAWSKIEEFKKGDIVETTYNCITNTIGEIISIDDISVTIIGMEGEVSHHKKDRLRIVKND